MWSLFIGGQFWVGWWWGSAYATFFLDVCGLRLLPELERAARANAEQSQSACWWWPHRDFVMVCERPRVIARDNGGRLHDETGPAIAWEGYELHLIHGVRVSKTIVEQPQSITLADIDAEKNAEVRRIMVDRMGVEKFIRLSGMQPIDEDRDTAGQPRKLYRHPDGRLTLRLVNSTEDAGNTRRVYWMDVHPECRPLLSNGGIGEPQKPTALNAVASSYGMTGKEYAQLITET
jgi:hypothetical protein